jgi:hypothetical protein
METIPSMIGCFNTYASDFVDLDSIECAKKIQTIIWSHSIRFDQRMKTSTFVTKRDKTNFATIIDEIEIAHRMRPDCTLGKTSSTNSPTRIRHRSISTNKKNRTTVYLPLIYGVIIEIGQIFVFTDDCGKIVRSRIVRNGLEKIVSINIYGWISQA